MFTDNGPPFNGGERHELQEYFRWAGVQHKANRSAEGPEANGLAESFMKHIKKSWHSATLDKKDPILEINKHLRVQRATPHPSTGAAPAELLNHRNYKTRLPDITSGQTQYQTELTYSKPGTRTRLSSGRKSTGLPQVHSEATQHPSEGPGAARQEAD